MAQVELKVARIGNSRGVRLPVATLARYRITNAVTMEERSDGILLRPRGHASGKLSWDETARAMAAAAEDWSEWDVTTADGLEKPSWAGISTRRVAEGEPEYRSRSGSRRRKKR